MGEPVRLYKGEDTVTVYGPAAMAALLADGWTQGAAVTVVDDYGDVIAPAMDEAPAAATTTRVRAQYGAQVGTAQVVDRAKLREVAKQRAKDRRDGGVL